MGKPRIHQYHEAVSERDAIGENILALQKILLESNCESEVFYEDCSDALKDRLISFERYKEFRSPDNLLLIHYSIGNPNLKRLLELPDKKVLIYHNITPGQYFREVCSRTAELCEKGRQELPHIARFINRGIGVSEFNCGDLKQAGFKETFHIPLMVDFKKYNVPPNPALLEELQKQALTNWLFVGRMTPHKKQDDVIKVFYYYQKYINPESRLVLVGNTDGMFFYKQYLKRLVAHLKLKNVEITGSISQEDLMAYYRVADLFICMSEHEGFCVPLIEAMVSQTPILAFNSSAVGETLGSSGALVSEKEFPLIGELAHYILQRSDLRQHLIQKQQERVKSFSNETVKQKWQDVLLNMAAS